MNIKFSKMSKVDENNKFFRRFYFLLEERNVFTEDKYKIGDDETRNGSFSIEIGIPEDLFEDESVCQNDNIVTQIAAYYTKFRLKEIVRNGYVLYREIIEDIDIYSNFELSYLNDDFRIDSFFGCFNVDKYFHIEHNYWHIQLHPNNSNWNKEIELLTNKECIGVADNNETVKKQFVDEIEIGDIILVRHISIPIALVEVVGKAQYKVPNANDLDWFEWRRKIRLLDTYSNADKEYYPRGILKKAINTNSTTYRNIDLLYKRYLGFQNKFNKFELTCIDIKDYKQFENFHCDFYDNNKKVMPIIIFIGENGVGKTTLFEILEKKFKKNKELSKYDISIKCNLDGKPLNNSDLNITLKEFPNPIIFLQAYTNDLSSVNSLIIKYINKLIRSKNFRATEAYKELREDIDEVLVSLNSSFSFCRIDENNNVFFSNKTGITITSDELSTGEKNILTKALYLHLSEIEGKIILVDEPELSLHPLWQRKILSVYNRIARNHNCQIILATHSPHVLSEAKNESIRILKKDINGRTECKQVSENSRSYGQKASDILQDIMGMDSLRAPDIQEKLDELSKMIDSKNFDKEIFDKKIKILENEIGFDDVDIGFLKIDAKIREKNK